MIHKKLLHLFKNSMPDLLTDGAHPPVLSVFQTHKNIRKEIDAYLTLERKVRRNRFTKSMECFSTSDSVLGVSFGN